ncbi:MAG: hypothetical protein FWH31_07255 [Streptococcaceae bacterium]|nr:hypothetical protein [Streptococcaceae bacterium]
MAPHDLEHFTQEIDKTKNWSNHRKSMYGMSIMDKLSITDGSVSTDSTQNPIIPASDRALTTQLVTEILDKLVKYDEITLIDCPILPISVSHQTDSFPHTLFLSQQPGIQYILNTHFWIKVMDDIQNTLALVVTGGLTGTFTFYCEKSDGKFEEFTIPFNKNGIYQLTNLTVDTLYLKDSALKLKK